MGRRERGERAARGPMQIAHGAGKGRRPREGCPLGQSPDRVQALEKRPREAGLARTAHDSWGHLTSRLAVGNGVPARSRALSLPAPGHCLAPESVHSGDEMSVFTGETAPRPPSPSLAPPPAPPAPAPA